MSNIVYKASVYSREISYTNFNGDDRTVKLFFALDPLKLMGVMASVPTRKTVKSGNPAKNGTELEISDEQQVKMIQKIASESAGTPSEDGETWHPYEDFANDLAGQAFLTKLVSSDADRKEFSESVILAPFRAFVAYAEADDSNTPKEVAELTDMMRQLENAFKVEPEKPETVEEKKARLMRELEGINGTES